VLREEWAGPGEMPRGRKKKELKKGGGGLGQAGACHAGCMAHATGRWGSDDLRPSSPLEPCRRRAAAEKKGREAARTHR
jgi:hypothetical protein